MAGRGANTREACAASGPWEDGVDIHAGTFLFVPHTALLSECLDLKSKAGLLQRVYHDLMLESPRHAAFYCNGSFHACSRPASGLMLCSTPRPSDGQEVRAVLDHAGFR